MSMLTKAEICALLQQQCEARSNEPVNHLLELEQQLLSTSCEPQRRFILDTSKRKVALCTRRASKTFGLGIQLILEGFKFPGSSLVYINKTITTAQRTVLKDIVGPLNRAYNLGLEVVNGQVRFPNGSVIYLVGVDSSDQERNKLLGQKYRMACVDEPQDYRIDLEDLIERVLAPALADYAGILALAGTPSDNTRTYFYELTKCYNNVRGWSFHKWSALENISVPFGSDKRVCDLVRDTIENILRDAPGAQDTAWFRQQWLGEWVVDEKALVYRCFPHNFISTLPAREYTYILSVDLGWNDANAFAVGAWSKYDNTLYIIDGHKEPGLDFSAVAAAIKQYRARYNLHRIVIDNANKQGVEEMKRRHGLPLLPADKSDKINAIAMLNADLAQARIKLLPGVAQLVKSEWDALIWDKHSERQQEDSRFDNHIADAVLYLWRASRAYQAAPSPKKLNVQEEYDERCDRAEERAMLSTHDRLAQEYGW